MTGFWRREARFVMWLRPVALVVWIGFIAVGAVPVYGASPVEQVPQQEADRPVTEDAKALQDKVDQTPAGGTVLVPPGTYAGSLTIARPIRLEAAGEGTATLVHEGDGAALSILADQVTVIGLHIIDEKVKTEPSVLVQGQEVRLERLHIRTGSHGIRMRDASDGEVKDSVIEWSRQPAAQEVKLTDKGNGIDLYNAHRNTLSGNRIASVYDGIYMENSDDNLVEDNRIEHSRYGIHCMYTQGTVIRGNVGHMNITGAMVMTTRNVEVAGNRFAKQNENVNSQGILLYDAHETTVRDNVVDGNRVGLYVEQSTNNRMTGNELSGNFIGIQLLDSDDNTANGNRFAGNVADALAQNSSNNGLSGNYWDAFQGIDTDGDGRSDISYAINPFFQGLIAKRPAFQLFFQSPGIVFLEGIYQSDRGGWTKDSAPLMAPPALGEGEKRDDASGVTGVAGGLLVGLAGILILWMRRREA